MSFTSLEALSKGRSWRNLSSKVPSSYTKRQFVMTLCIKLTRAGCINTTMCYTVSPPHTNWCLQKQNMIEKDKSLMKILVSCSPRWCSSVMFLPLDGWQQQGLQLEASAHSRSPYTPGTADTQDDTLTWNFTAHKCNNRDFCRIRQIKDLKKTNKYNTI